jgi:hypothetical protein
MWRVFWKSAFTLCFAFSVLFLVTGIRQAMTGPFLDLYFRDHYLVISRVHLFVITAVFAIATYVVWKLRLAH